MIDGFRRAQARWDAMEPPEGIPDERIEAAALDLVGDFDPTDKAQFRRAVERATGAYDLSDSQTLDRVWRDHQPEIGEE